MPVTRSISRNADEAPLIMGIVNVTGDSFYGASRTPAMDEALAAVARFVADGAGIIDIGGESTRPGAETVDEAAERDRVLPLVREVRRVFPHIGISLDTRKASVARAGIAAGADIINDVSAGTYDNAMLAVVGASDAHLILMHMKGTPKDMQASPHYDDVTSEVTRYFDERIAAANTAGIGRERLLLDPGVGFGKTLEHNRTLIGAIPHFKKTFGLPLVAGLSRKRFIGDITGRAVEDRLAGSLGAAVAAMTLGADILRVHDVRETVDAVKVAWAVSSAVCGTGAAGEGCR
ncbi:MAG: dihydropteroate synthase [Spirochaetes bacterium]|nr:dihydropteroate synthase [Spirochaetota bacterium]